MKKSDLAPIRRPMSLNEMAYDRIKEAIITLQFRPGQAISHRTLAEQLDISGTPIREALQELGWEGFIVRVPYKGTFVTHIDPKDIEDTFQIRAELEAMAVRRVVAGLQPVDHRILEAYIDEAERAYDAGDPQRCSFMGSQFHRFFIEHTGNQRLIGIFNNLDDHIRRFRSLSDAVDGRLGRSQAEHRRVFEAVTRGDAEGAAAAMRAHLDSALADVRTSAWWHAAHDEQPT